MHSARKVSGTFEKQAPVLYREGGAEREPADIDVFPVVASQRRQEIRLCPRAMLSAMLSLLYFLDFKSYNVYAVKPS